MNKTVGPDLSPLMHSVYLNMTKLMVMLILAGMCAFTAGLVVRLIYHKRGARPPKGLLDLIMRGTLGGSGFFFLYLGFVVFGTGAAKDIAAASVFGPFVVLGLGVAAILGLAIFVLLSKGVMSDFPAPNRRSGRFAQRASPAPPGGDKPSAAQKGGNGESWVKGVLRIAKCDAIHGVHLPSRDDDWTQIDHVALVGGLILVIETKNFSGLIFGDAKDARWTQVFSKEVRETFPNPLRQNYGHTLAVKQATGLQAGVRGLVVFVGDAEFPNGVPNGVVLSAGFLEHLRKLSLENPVTPAANATWASLKTTVGQTNNEISRRLHQETLVRKGASQARQA